MTQALFDEFKAEFWRSSGVIRFTQVSIKKLVDDLPPIEPTGENPDPQIFLGWGDPNTGVPADASWRKSELDGAAQPDGWLQQWLTDAWIALIFARWEYHYRPEFARLSGTTYDKVACDVMGDLRLLRNDVLHNRGIVSAGRTSKCKILVRFNPNDRVVLTAEDVRHLLANLAVAVDPS